MTAEPRALGGPTAQRLADAARAGHPLQALRGGAAALVLGLPAAARVIATSTEARAPPLLRRERQPALPRRLLHHHRVAPLNAHELQRVGGIEASRLFRRCVSMLTSRRRRRAPLPRRAAAHEDARRWRPRGVHEAAGEEENAPALTIRALHLTQRELGGGARGGRCPLLQPGCQEVRAAGAVVFCMPRTTTSPSRRRQEGVEASETNAQFVANERARAANALRRLAGNGAGTARSSHAAVAGCSRSTWRSSSTRTRRRGVPGCSLSSTPSETPYLVWNSRCAWSLEFTTSDSRLVPVPSSLSDSHGLVDKALADELKVGSVCGVYTSPRPPAARRAAVLRGHPRGPGRARAGRAQPRGRPRGGAAEAPHRARARAMRRCSRRATTSTSSEATRRAGCDALRFARGQARPPDRLQARRAAPGRRRHRGRPASYLPPCSSVAPPHVESC